MIYLVHNILLGFIYRTVRILIFCFKHIKDSHIMCSLKDSPGFHPNYGSNFAPFCLGRVSQDNTGFHPNYGSNFAPFFWDRVSQDNTSLHSTVGSHLSHGIQMEGRS